jgi:hypothetical protein
VASERLELVGVEAEPARSAPFHSADGFAVVPWAFDGDADDKVSESHCSGETSCTTVADRAMSFDYNDVPGCLGDSCCSVGYSTNSRDGYSGVAVDAVAAAVVAAVAAAVGQRWLAFGFELVLVWAKLVVLRSLSCFVCQSTRVEVLELLEAMVERQLSVYPIHQ